MANPSVSIPDELMEEFDSIREAMEGEMPAGAKLSRSAVIQELMEGWVEENRHYLEGDDTGNPNPIPVPS